MCYGPSSLPKPCASGSGRIGAKTAYIAPGSPWENGYCESFNSKLRDELLAGEHLSTLHEAKVVIEQWRRHYNAIRPHSLARLSPACTRDDLAVGVCSALRCAPVSADADQ